MTSSFIVLFFFFIMLFMIKGRSMVVFLPVALYVFDFGFQFLPTMSAITYSKLALIVISLLLFTKELYKFPIKILYLFIFYILILLIFTDETFVSLKNTSKVVLSFMFLALGYIGKFRLKYLVTSILIIMLLSFLGSIIGYIFDIGETRFYGSSDEAMGLVKGGNFYPVAISMVLVIYLTNIYYWKSSIKKYFWVFLSIATFILILLTLRRTAILLPVAGILAYIYFSGKFKKGVQYLLLVSVILVSSFPLYQDVLERRFEIRADAGRFESNFYETEARYVTTLWTLEETFSFEDPIKSFFGRNVFAGGWRGGTVERMYHADHNQLLNTTGIIGTIIYFAIFFKIVVLTLRIKGKQFKNQKAIIYSLLVMIALISLNGSIFITTFRSIIFLVIGYFLGSISREYNYSRLLKEQNNSRSNLNSP
jgi:hypothetical protein